MAALLEVRELRVRFAGGDDALRGVSFSLERGESPGADSAALAELRWEIVSIALQGAPLHPTATIGAQLAEPLRERRRMDRTRSRRRARELAGELGLAPELLERISELAAARGFGLVVLTHDLPAAARLSPRCLVLYAGEAIEAGDSRGVVDRPAHPYTAGLVRAYPVMSTTKDLRPIRGAPPDPRALPGGCAFWPRCTQTEPVCREQRPVLQPVRGRLVACHPGGLRRVLSAVGLSRGFRRAGRETSALRGVSLDVVHGEAVGVVGPSASGKTTLARILAGQLDADSGEVRLDPDRAPPRDAARALRARVQLVMQDPWEALSARLGVEARVHELSGGQLQRTALARALIAEPDVLVADEPTSMLDASEQARLLVVLRERQTQMGLALVLISHDLALVRKVTDRIVVLDAGRVVEQGSSQRVGASPSSDTARALVASAPSFELGER